MNNDGTFLFPQDDDLARRYVAQLWPLDTYRVTKEDANKTAMMQAEVGRRQIAASTSSFADFIASLQVMTSHH